MMACAPPLSTPSPWTERGPRSPLASSRSSSASPSSPSNSQASCSPSPQSGCAQWLGLSSGARHDGAPPHSGSPTRSPLPSARALKEQGLSVLGPAPPAVQSEWRQLLMQDRAALRSIVALCSSCRANKKAATHARAKPTAEGEGDYEMGTLPREEAKSDGTESPRPPMAAVLTVGGMGQWAQAALWWFTLRWRVRAERRSGDGPMAHAHLPPHST